MLGMKKKSLILMFLFAFVGGYAKKENTKLPGKPEWQPVLKYTLDLHKKSTHPAQYPFDNAWEEIGPGYHLAPAFGHWDIVHQVYDALVYNPEHGLNQLYNNIKNQEAHGMLPGSIWFPRKGGKHKEVRWSKKDEGHPPLWIYAVDEYVNQTGNSSILIDFYAALVRQITWFENERKAKGKGFFYNDIIKRRWESGVDQGIRFDEADLGPQACIDATSHVYALYFFADKWGKKLGVKTSFYAEKAASLKSYVNNELFDSKKGSYFDSWSVNDPKKQHFAFENIWPIIVGIAPQKRAEFYIENYVMSPKHFLSKHPTTTVSMSDPKFELRMWRGPVWNSMSFWVAKACIRYGKYEAAKVILERSLNETASQFKLTGKIWEFYHPHGGSPEDVKRKNGSRNMPCSDYLGHNPLIAMAKLYDEIKNK
ncbi:hypothetical protein EMN47_09230 [Prolixibacteraceae bacterium JC049]|nr:hypothetical protein [Prolixibacteraceae bacterium JC049]